MERIILESSNENDLVLDPFCGCGTAIAVAERLNRRWVGIDITHLAVTLMKHRLLTRFGPSIEERYEVIGEPVSLPDAEALAVEDPYQFQWWALGLVGAWPVEQKKGADKGIDGRLFFHDEAALVDRLVAGDIDLEEAAESIVGLGRRQEVAGVASGLLERAGDAILGNAIRELEGIGDRLTTEYRRPVFERIVDELAKLAPKVDGITSDEQSVRAGKTASEAWRRAVELTAHLTLVRNAARGFSPRGECCGARPPRPRLPPGPRTSV